MKKNSEQKTEREADWEPLMECWRRLPDSVPAPPVLLAHVRRREFRLQLAAVMDWLAAAFAVGVVVYMLLCQFSAYQLFWGLVILALVAWAMVFSINNRRDLWSPADGSVQAYMRLSLLRLERRRRTLRFMWILFAVELVIIALWQLAAIAGWLPWSMSVFPLRMLGVLAVALAIMLVWTWIAFARIRREAQELAGLQRNL